MVLKGVLLSDLFLHQTVTLLDQPDLFDDRWNLLAVQVAVHEKS